MTRKDILQALSKYEQDRRDEFGIVRIGVFGSAARGRFADESDVDVVVELANPDLFALIGIKQDLETLLSRPVDVVRYRENMNAFRIDPLSFLPKFVVVFGCGGDRVMILTPRSCTRSAPGMFPNWRQALHTCWMICDRGRERRSTQVEGEEMATTDGLSRRRSATGGRLS